MPRMDMDSFSHLAVPMYEFDQNGVVMPNPLFHRPSDKLHSRCIEYPCAASKVRGAKRILDVGTVKSGPIWISWLESLPIEVHATDYDEPFRPFERVKFHQGDVRRLPLPDETFDKVIAVSVIEHIGLQLPQTLRAEVPKVSEEGDVEAVRELSRLLKPGGELIMTVPFGLTEGLVLGNQARSYTADSIRKFNKVIQPVNLEYFEYQSRIIKESKKEPPDVTVSDNIYMAISSLTRWFHAEAYEWREKHADIPGEVTWRNIPISDAKATNKRHINGVLCGVWKKSE